MNDPSFLQYGDLLITREPSTYRPKDLLGWVFKRGLYHAQTIRHGDAPDWARWTTHVRMYRGGGTRPGLWHSTTWPRTVAERFDLVAYRKPFAIVRYAHLPEQGWPDAAIVAMEAEAEKMIGSHYEWQQILSMLAKDLFPNILPEQMPLFGESEKRTVCSSACHALWLKGWKAALREQPRPLGDQYFETTHPVDLIWEQLAGGLTTRIVYAE